MWRCSVTGTLAWGTYCRMFGLLVFAQLLASSVVDCRSFEIDFNNDRFLKDGEPFRYISGTMHYFRVPEAYWRDRLQKLRACGFNTVQTLIPWNVHEPRPGEYDFEGRNDLIGFLQVAQDLGIYVLLAPGPFVSGDVENGGLPWWLNKVPNIQFRTHESLFLGEVKSWLRKVLKMVLPYVYKNGGPVIAFQLENEYGWGFLPCNKQYLEALRDTYRQYLGNDVVIYTVDNSWVNLGCGSVSGVYATVNFGTWESARNGFGAQRRVSPRGPLVNSEFYPGWATLWGYPDTTEHFSVAQITRTFTEMYDMGASINFYMFEGGSNFGYLAAGSGEARLHKFVAQTNDYGALLTEDGQTTPKYSAIQSEIERLQGRPIAFVVPPKIWPAAYGTAEAVNAGSIIDLINDGFGEAVSSRDPRSFEELDFPYGFVVYETEVPFDGSSLTVKEIEDLAYVLVDHKFYGWIGLHNGNTLSVQASRGQTLRIMVEHLGRHQDGIRKYKKGILSDVVLSGRTLVGWRMYKLELEKLFDPDRVDRVLGRLERLKKRSPDRSSGKLDLSIEFLAARNTSYTETERTKRDDDEEGVQAASKENASPEADTDSETPEPESGAQEPDSEPEAPEPEEAEQAEEPEAEGEEAVEKPEFDEIPQGRKLKPHKWVGGKMGPNVFIGSFDIEGAPRDTFLDPTGWGHGQFLINGHNVGKYWPALGPQVTLWVPAPWLKEGRNIFVMFECSDVPSSCSMHVEHCPVRFVDAARRSY